MALVYVPVDLFDKLRLSLRSPASRIYNNPDPSASELMDKISPNMPLLAGEKLGNDAVIGKAKDDASDPDVNSKGAAPFGSDVTSDKPVNPQSVAVGSGVAVGVALYGGAMYMLARRYRKRRQRHERASSTSPASRHMPQMAQSNMWAPVSHRPGTYYGDSYGSRNSSSSNGRSIRTVGISAPVMAENSLGWN